MMNDIFYFLDEFCDEHLSCRFFDHRFNSSSVAIYAGANSNGFSRKCLRQGAGLSV
jgi:hypothetical protein